MCELHIYIYITSSIMLCCTGIDYSVRTLNLGDSLVALQLWDAAGQER